MANIGRPTPSSHMRVSSRMNNRQAYRLDGPSCRHRHQLSGFASSLRCNRGVSVDPPAANELRTSTDLTPLSNRTAAVLHSRSVICHLLASPAFACHLRHLCDHVNDSVPRAALGQMVEPHDNPPVVLFGLASPPSVLMLGHLNDKGTEPKSSDRVNSGRGLILLQISEPSPQLNRGDLNHHLSMLTFWIQRWIYVILTPGKMNINCRIPAVRNYRL
jgi:hypothetical protein